MVQDGNVLVCGQTSNLTSHSSRTSRTSLLFGRLNFGLSEYDLCRCPDVLPSSASFDTPCCSTCTRCGGSHEGQNVLISKTIEIRTISKMCNNWLLEPSEHVSKNVICRLGMHIAKMLRHAPAQKAAEWPQTMTRQVW